MEEGKVALSAEMLSLSIQTNSDIINGFLIF